MRIRFANAMMLDGSRYDITVCDDRIESAREASKPIPSTECAADRVIDCKNRMLIPGLYNLHCHVAMGLFRGYGEDMPLDRWLNERIFPAEDRLTERAVYVGSQWGIAEMLRGGVVSFSDMYYFCDQTVRAAIESGIKVNTCRSVVSFDPCADFAKDSRLLEGKALFDSCHGLENGRIRVDLSLHAEYTNVEGMCREMAQLAKELKTGMQIHLSETKAEHEACIARHGMTPAAFFAHTGVLDVPTTAAHCVWVDEQDAKILAEKKVTVAHNPASNLKLGSGVMPLGILRNAGVNVALGTDSSASNNTLDVMKEMYLAAILHKGVNHTPQAFCAREFFDMATVCGARAQGRYDCGEIAPGKKADIVLIDLEALNMYPMFDPVYALVYAGNARDVKLTMVDGKILYENGEYTTIDIEKLKYDMRDTCEHYF